MGQSAASPGPDTETLMRFDTLSPGDRCGPGLDALTARIVPAASLDLGFEVSKSRADKAPNHDGAEPGWAHTRIVLPLYDGQKVLSIRVRALTSSLATDSCPRRRAAFDGEGPNRSVSKCSVQSTARRRCARTSLSRGIGRANRPEPGHPATG